MGLLSCLNYLKVEVNEHTLICSWYCLFSSSKSGLSLKIGASKHRKGLLSVMQCAVDANRLTV